MDSSKLYQVRASYFTAGLVMDAGLVTNASPILRWMLGLTLGEVKRAAARRGWAITEVETMATRRGRAAIKMGTRNGGRTKDRQP